MADDFSVILKSLREHFPKELLILVQTEGGIILRSSITEASEAALFVETYENITRSRFKLYNQKNKTNSLDFKKEWVCQHRILAAESEDKCQAKVSITVKRITNKRKHEEFLHHSPPLPAIIKIIPHHNHLIKEASSPRLVRIPSEVRNMYYGYFKKGITGVKAKRMYEENLLKCNVTALDGTRINPRVNAIYTLYKRWKMSQNRQATKVPSDSGAECLARERTSQQNIEIASSSYENSENKNPSLVVYNTGQRISQQYIKSTSNSHETLEYQHLSTVEYSTSQEDRKRASENYENEIPVIKIEEEADEDDSPLPKIVSCCSLAPKKEKNVMAQNKKNSMIPHRGNNVSNTVTPNKVNNKTTPNNGNVMMPANTGNNIPHTNTKSNMMPLNTGSIIMPESTGNMMPMANIPILTNSSVDINNQPMPFITSQIISPSPTNLSLPLQRVVPISAPHIILYNPSSNTFTVVQLNSSTSPIVNSSNLYSTYFPDRIQLPTRVGVHKL